MLERERIQLERVGGDRDWIRMLPRALQAAYTRVVLDASNVAALAPEIGPRQLYSAARPRLDYQDKRPVACSSRPSAPHAGDAGKEQGQ